MPLNVFDKLLDLTLATKPNADTHTAWCDRTWTLLHEAPPCQRRLASIRYLADFRRTRDSGTFRLLAEQITFLRIYCEGYEAAKAEEKD